MVGAVAMQRGGRALTTKQLNAPSRKQNSLVRFITGGQGRGLESERLGFIPALRGEFYIWEEGGSCYQLCYRRQGWGSRALQLPEGLIQIAVRSPNIRING